MANTFLTTFSAMKPLAPALEIDTGTADGNVTGKLVDSTSNWLTSNVKAGDIAVCTSGTLDQARILDVESDTTILLDKDIFPAGTETYQIIKPSRDIIAPGIGQELILFQIRIINPQANGTSQQAYILKEGFDRWSTYPLAKIYHDGTDLHSVAEVTGRLLPTNTEYYVVENADPVHAADYYAEGLDKTLAELLSGATPQVTTSPTP